MRELTELASADAYCRLLARRHYENFSVASKLVGARRARDLMRIYAYCRTTDDFGDESSDKNAALARLESWRAQVRDLFAGTMPVHPVLLALRETVNAHALPAQPFLDLISANVQDQQVSQYAKWADLRAYCMLSAAPVGRMVLGVFEIHDARAPELSDDVCVGLQLANHAQDVGRDATRGRSYLIGTDVRADDPTAAVRGLCERARDLLDSGRELEEMTPMPLRLQLALYRLGGLAIVDGIKRVGYRTQAIRPTVSATTKAWLLVRAFAACVRENSHAQSLETV